MIAAFWNAYRVGGLYGMMDMIAVIGNSLYNSHYLARKE